MGLIFELTSLAFITISGICAICALDSFQNGRWKYRVRHSNCDTVIAIVVLVVDIVVVSAPK